MGVSIGKNLVKRYLSNSRNLDFIPSKIVIRLWNTDKYLMLNQSTHQHFQKTTPFLEYNKIYMPAEKYQDSHCTLDLSLVFKY